VRTFRAHHSSAFVVPFGVFVGFAALTYTAAGGGAVGASVEVSRDGVSARPLPERPVNRADTRARLNTAYGRLPLSFEENRGQADSGVRFLSHGHGYRVFVATTETVLILQRPNPVEGAAGNRHSDARATSGTPVTAVTMRLVGANADAPSGGLEKLPGKVNYFIGNDPARWRTDVPTYARVMTRNVYPGIDIIHRGHQRELEYDFVVAPGADPADIRVSFIGIQKMHLDSNGDLVLATDAGEMRQHTPYIYQDRGGVRHAIAGAYVLKGGNEVGFAVGAYDAALPLVLDPVLAYSTYLGGNANDEARAIAVDAGGNAYIAGVTSSATTFPRIGGIVTMVGGLDAFVSKLNAAGDSLVYSTFIGHEQSESAEAVAVDDNGHAYVAGYTRSLGFPTTPGGYQLSINTGNYSAFVTRLNADGNGLVYSTFLGGNIASTPGTMVPATPMSRAGRTQSISRSFTPIRQATGARQMHS
jgi:hypothetical protein